MRLFCKNNTVTPNGPTYFGEANQPFVMDLTVGKQYNGIIEFGEFDTPVDFIPNKQWVFACFNDRQEWSVYSLRDFCPAVQP